jgi:DNA-3-methyladenine glycosylase I
VSHSDRAPSSSGIRVGPDGVPRCWWSDADDLYRRYHDVEWGRPVDSDRALFEKLSLDGFQSGLSWLTILRKRENFRAAFRAFEPAALARFTGRDIARLMNDVGIVRNRAKIESTVNNARRMRDVIEEFGSFAAYVWRFEPEPRGRFLSRSELLKIKICPEAITMSTDLRKRGWKFVGPTTVYSFMQSMGLVNDHVTGCAAADEVEKSRVTFIRPRSRGNPVRR